MNGVGSWVCAGVLALMPLAVAAQEPTRSEPCPGCPAATAGAPLSPGTPEARAALLGPLRLTPSTTTGETAGDPVEPQFRCVEAALVAGATSAAEELSRAAWLASWLPVDREPAAPDLSAAGLWFALSAGYTAVRCISS